MEIPGKRANIFSYISEKGDDIVLCHLLQFIHPIDIERSLLFDLLNGLVRNLSQFGESFTDDEFDLEPGLELSLFGPDSCHLRPGISRYHPELLSFTPLEIMPRWNF